MVFNQALSNWFQYPAYTSNVQMRLVNILEERFKVCMIVVCCRVTSLDISINQLMSLNDDTLDDGRVCGVISVCYCLR